MVNWSVLSSVKFLQTMVVLLIIACVVIFSWKSVTSDEYGRTKIGRIEFDPEQLLGKERVQNQACLR